MKFRVEYDKPAWWLTIGLTLAFICGLCFTCNEPVAFCSIAAIAVPTYIVSLYFAPMSISADDREILIHSSLKIRSIPLSEVVKIERYRPARGTIRICASGGFMGYWGTFRDTTAGKYTGYWGDSSQCFLITLANGRKYLLGCKNTDAMTAYIAARMNS